MTRTGALAGGVAVGLAAQLVAGCGGGSSGATGPQGTVDQQAAQGKRNVTLGLRDRFLYDHNAAFFGGRTGRWVTPIPIHVTGDPELDHILAAEARAWEGPLGVGASLYQPLGPTRKVPQSGIFFAVDDLPGTTIGVADPYFQGRSGNGGAPSQTGPCHGCPGPAPRATGGAPERRDPAVRDRPGREPGFSRRIGGPRDATTRDRPLPRLRGHVKSGLMRSTCCVLTITPNVVRMMRRLYSLPPGTEVTS